MPFLTQGLPLASTFSGSERLALDTYLASGAQPQQEAIGISRLALIQSYFSNYASSTPVNGTRYYTSTAVGTNGTVLTGINVLIGATGGTNNLIVELHDSTGALVATSALAGVLAGTANTWQQIPFTAPVTVNAGTYFIVVQANGTTVRLATFNSPTSPHLTGSAAGTFGTSASITPPTTYTAGVGPAAFAY